VNELRFGVVLVNYNGWSDTRECLDSLRACSYLNRSIVVVDNASTEDHSEELQERHPDVHWVRATQNTGWSGGNNLGIQFFLQGANPPDVIFLLNNDTIVSGDLFEVLSEGFRQGVDITGPVINEYSDPEVIQTQGTAFNRKDASQDFFSVIPTPIVMDRVEITPVDIVNGCAVAISRRVFEKVGLIDDRFFLICEESDFCLRAQSAGFHCGLIHRSLVFHKHSVTFARAGKPIQRYYGWRNLWLLLKKHPNGGKRKSILASRLLYFRRSFHIFSHECELGNIAGADAVCDGISDALLGRYGKWREKKNWLGRLLRYLYYAMWKFRGGKQVN
jgi:GT2 family glycosyltransferase